MIVRAITAICLKIKHGVQHMYGVFKWVDVMSLAGKTIVITGASKGLGFVMAKHCATQGAFVILTARDLAGLRHCEQEIQNEGGKCAIILCDLQDPADIQSLSEQISAITPNIDVLVNNAGIARINPLLSLTAEDWDDTYAVNLRAPFLLAKALVPKMIEQKSGKIINVSSQAGTVAIEEHGAYCAVKGGLNLLTKMMAAEWSRFNIQVNAIAPTVIMTDMGQQVWGEPEKSAPMLAKIPLRRFGQPLEVAQLIEFLASNASDLITGEVIHIDGGYSCI